MERARLRDRWAFVAVSVWALGSAVALWRADPAAFAVILGPVNPVLAVVLAIALAGFSLRALGRDGAPPPAAGSGLAEASLLAAVFALAVIAVDLTLGYPAEINQPWPRSLLFYPVAALIAPTVFILAPLALAARAIRPRRPGVAVFVAVALFEPAFQLWFATRSGTPGWTEVYTTFHVFAFGLVQIVLLRRFGFAAMIGLRIVYYALWHVAWGTIRLPLAG